MTIDTFHEQIQTSGPADDGVLALQRLRDSEGTLQALSELQGLARWQSWL
ncbi:MAG: hypothetical protein AAGN66_28865 [Acidobacteriota bacterium]